MCGPNGVILIQADQPSQWFSSGSFRDSFFMGGFYFGFFQAFFPIGKLVFSGVAKRTVF